MNGYDLSKFHRVPIELTPRGAFLIIEANDQSLCFGVNTGATLSIINGEKTIFEDFSIEGKNYGPMELYGFDLPQSPEKVDGFLGMDFFLSSPLFRFPNKTPLYFLIKKSVEISWRIV